MEGGSGEKQDTDRSPKSECGHRHTPRQIQVMERVFKTWPRPDDEQRQELSKDLGLTSIQIKLWFQGKRTSEKAQRERSERTLLLAEMEKLRQENVSMRETMKNAKCAHCGGPATKDEILSDDLIASNDAQTHVLPPADQLS